MDRLIPALLVPVGVALAVILIVSGIGTVLLILASIVPEMGGLHEPLSIFAALLLAVGILGVSAYLASRPAGTHNDLS